MHFLSDDECRRLVNTCNGAFRDLVHAALLTGCRYGELVRMRVADFNAAAGTITVQISKAGKPRHVALTDEGQTVFKTLTSGRTGRDAIFVHDDGKTWGPSHRQRPLTSNCVEKLRLIWAPVADSLLLAQEIRSMMGERRVMQEALFYGFSLERHVPDDHLLRKIDRFVDFRRSGRIWVRTTARWVGPRSIRS